MVPKVLKYAGKVHVRVYRLTRGRIGGRWRIGAGWKKPVPTLLLDHVGRTSGRAFTTPLLYLLDGPNVVVVASQGGLPKNPQWYANLVATPETKVQIKGEVRAVRAHTADLAEAEAGRAVRRLRQLPVLDRPGDPGRRAHAWLGAVFPRGHTR
jgi:deazaflavin-dependent oxidoreductase (nitroreductase family)